MAALSKKNQAFIVSQDKTKEFFQALAQQSANNGIWNQLNRLPNQVDSSVMETIKKMCVDDK